MKRFHVYSSVDDLAASGCCIPLAKAESKAGFCSVPNTASDVALACCGQPFFH